MIKMIDENDGNGALAPGGFHAATGVRMEDEESPPAAPEMVAVEVVGTSSKDLDVHGTAAAVLTWVDHAGRFERAKTACLVMAGFELLEIKRRMGFVQGGCRGQKPNDSVFASWQEFCRDQIGISDDTARGWMRMAEALKPRLRKLPGLGHLIREIIDVPLAQLSPEKCRLLEDAVHKLADGKTQLDFMTELGLVKSAQGSGARGGALGGGRHAQGQVTEEAARQIARDDWRTVGQKLVLAGHSFTLLDDAEVDGLIAAMTSTLAGMRRWRQAPKALRDDALVREVAEIVKS
jgi:hypothetical protein